MRAAEGQPRPAVSKSLNPLIRTLSSSKSSMRSNALDRAAAPKALTVAHRALVDGLPFPACLLDADAFVLHQNPAFRALTDVRQLCTGAHPNFSDLIDATHHERLLAVLSDTAPLPRSIEQCLTFVSSKGLVEQHDWSFVADTHGKFFVVIGKVSQQEEGKYQIEVSDNIAQSAWQKFRAKTRLDPSLKTQLGELDSKIKFLRCINEEIRSPLSSALSGLLVLSAKVGSKDSGALDDIKLAVLSVSDVLQQAILEDVGAEALLPRARARQSQDLFAVVSEAVGELQEERGDARITVTRDSAAPTPLPCDAQKMHAVVSNSVLCVVRAAGRDAAVGVHVQSASALVAGVEITAQVSVRRGGAPGVGGEVGALVAAMHRALAPAKSFLVSAGGILIVTTSGDGADVRVGVSIAVPRPAPVHPSAQHAPAQESPSLLPSGLLRGVKTAATEPAMRFLVVDDIEACRTSMVRRFEQSNIACDQAVDGMEAVVKVMAASEVARNYDAILLDDAMPILCGARAARMMREFGFAGLIYGLTEEVGSSDSGELEAAGMNKVFAKPLSPAIFDEIVAEARVQTLRST